MEDIDIEVIIQARSYALDAAVSSLRDSPWKSDVETVVEKAKRYEQYLLNGE